MISTIQGLIVFLFFIVPGFIVVEVSNFISPSRKSVSFDKTILSIIWSTLIHFPAIISITIVFWTNNANASLIFATDNCFGQIPFIALCYFIVACITAIVLGCIFPESKDYLLSKILGKNKNVLQATSVWEYVRTELRPSINGIPYSMRAKFNMKNGLIYIGYIFVMPTIIDDDKPYDIFIKDVAKIDAAGKKYELGNIDGMMLNSSNIDSIELKFAEPKANKISPIKKIWTQNTRKAFWLVIIISIIAEAYLCHLEFSIISKNMSNKTISSSATAPTMHNIHGKQKRPPVQTD